MAGKLPGRRALAAACAAGALVLLKSVPAVGAAPWLCAAVDALSLVELLLLTAPFPWPAALLGALVAGALDFLQGTVPWMLPVSIAAGHFLASLLWRGEGPRPLPRAALCALAAFAAQWLVVALGYALAKDLSFAAALRTAARSRWFAGAWYAAALALLVLRERFLDRRRGRAV